MTPQTSQAAPLRAQGRIHWFGYASPQVFYPIAGKLIPWFAGAALLLAAVGLAIGFLVAPTDRQQGDAYRIIFVHVPAAWLSMLIYVAMAFWAGLGLVLNSMWLVLAAVAVMLALRNLVIVHEERYLEEKFGDEYRAYKRKTWF